MNGNLYERDFYTWAIGQAHTLRDRNDSKLDWENLAEEILRTRLTETRMPSKVKAKG